ncbi:DUF5791 family protein [Halorarius halobius]|uniref:DUF5791 family protein n=1 Tax=Halorarius halobius TaxID=2962671 RepID=UPI0020CE5A1A|nr:DUF5791 family protein [Halorarius halobius]
MFHELADAPGERTPEELYAAYEAELVAVIEDVGVEAVAAESGVDPETLRALVDGESPELELEDAAAVLAVGVEESADDVTVLSRDALLMGMTNAVYDVEALSRELDGELEPREIQSKVEGRFPMTLREFALLHATIQERTR